MVTSTTFDIPRMTEDHRVPLLGSRRALGPHTKATYLGALVQPALRGPHQVDSLVLSGTAAALSLPKSFDTQSCLSGRSRREQLPDHTRQLLSIRLTQALITQQ